MKLELKHLAGYLPYELLICYRVLDLKNGDPATGNNDDKMKDCFMELTPSMLTVLDFKPILRPLSDLTKEIEEDFNVYTLLSLRSKNDYDDGSPLILKWSYEDIQTLLEYHFDIHELIENGLAIDVNTLNKFYCYEVEDEKLPICNKQCVICRSKSKNNLNK